MSLCNPTISISKIRASDFLCLYFHLRTQRQFPEQRGWYVGQMAGAAAPCRGRWPVRSREFTLLDSSPHTSHPFSNRFPFLFLVHNIPNLMLPLPPPPPLRSTASSLPPQPPCCPRSCIACLLACFPLIRSRETEIDCHS